MSGLPICRSTHLSLQLPGLLLSLERDEAIAFGGAAAVGDDLGGANVAEAGEQLVQVGFGRRVADPAHEDSVGDERAVFDPGYTAVGYCSRGGERRGRTTTSTEGGVT